MINHEKILNDFPLLRRQINDKPIVYFDSACMSLKPKQVIEAMNEYYYEYSACVGRSHHKLGELATTKVNGARKTIAEFINAKENEIIFTRNTTESINLLANSFNFQAGDIVLTTDKEHNSNLIPWQVLVRKKNIKHLIVKSTLDGKFNIEKYKKMIRGVKLVAMAHTSNLDGTTIPAKEIIRIAHENGALVFLDVAQSISHQKIDTKDLDVDFLAFSGHKILGPTGTGVLYGKNNLLNNLEPFIVGGSTVEFSTYTDHKMMNVPEKFEAGLQNYAGIIGFGEAIKYFQSIGYSDIQEHELSINEYITHKLLLLPRIKIIGPTDPKLRSGIFSFYMEGVDMHQFAIMLDEMSNIMVRSGQHCVHSWFKENNIFNSVRVSIYFYNTMKEAEVLVDNIFKISNII